MFALTPGDLLGKILDCAAGPSSFNAELSAEGHKVTSCDPIYVLTAEEIRARILATRESIVADVRAAREEFAWKEFISPEHPGKVRMAAMRRFLTDSQVGLAEGCYLALLHLDLHDDSFDPAPCSAFLFTYTEQLSATRASFCADILVCSSQGAPQWVDLSQLSA
jgi:hypothetical protein